MIRSGVRSKYLTLAIKLRVMTLGISPDRIQINAAAPDIFHSLQGSRHRTLGGCLL